MRPHLTLAATFLAFTAAQAAPPTPPPLNLTLTCPNGNPMWLPSTTRPPILAVIIQFVSKAAAQQRMVNTELRNGATIDPAYTHNQRVLVQDAYHRRYFLLVPTGMTIHIGQDIAFTPGHADPGNLCLYTPSLIIP